MCFPSDMGCQKPQNQAWSSAQTEKGTRGRGRKHIPESGEMRIILSSFFSVQKKRKEKRILWSRRRVGRAWWSKSASSLETSVKHFSVSEDNRLLNLSPESFRSNSGWVCPWTLMGRRGSCSRGDSHRSFLAANSFMPFSICIFSSKLYSSEDEKYLQQNCALLQRSHSRRRCGHTRLSCSECPTPPVLSIP